MSWNYILSGALALFILLYAAAAFFALRRAKKTGARSGVLALGLLVLVGAYVVWSVGLPGRLSHMQVGDLLLGLLAVPVGIAALGLLFGSVASRITSQRLKPLRASVLLLPPVAMLAGALVLDMQVKKDRQARAAALQSFQQETLSATFGAQDIRIPVAPNMSASYDCEPTPSGQPRFCMSHFGSQRATRIKERASDPLALTRFNVYSVHDSCKEGACVTTATMAQWCAARPEMTGRVWCEATPQNVAFSLKRPRPREEDYDFDRWSPMPPSGGAEAVFCMTDHRGQTCKAHFRTASDVYASATFYNLSAADLDQAIAATKGYADQVWQDMTAF